ncbi:MAG: phage tail protein [Gemmatimonadota bacterium]
MFEQRSSTGRRGFLRHVPGFLAALAGGAALSGLRPARLPAIGPAVTPEKFGGENWIGEIVTVPYSFAPRGFAFCEGQELPVQQYQALFSLIGTYFGGDGRTTFKLPDTRPLELAHQKQLRASRPPFRYAIALTGLFPSRS